MQTARLIVCERSNEWLLALRWCLADGSIRVCHLHDWDACWGQLEAAPASVLMLELSEEPATTIDGRLLEFPARFPAARLIVMGETGCGPSLWLARELGAVHAASSIRDLTTTARVVRRHFDQLPEEPAGVREQIWSRMPWRDENTTILN